MLKTLAVVQACLHSDSFRSQANRKLGGQSLLERVVRRVTDAARLDGVAVLACDAAECSVISKLVPSDVPVFVSDKPDMLARFARMLEEYQTEAVVRIHGDDLFVDPTLIDRLITAAESFSDCDYASYSSRDGRPAIASRVGRLRRVVSRQGAASCEPLCDGPGRSPPCDSLSLLEPEAVRRSPDSRAHGNQSRGRSIDCGQR